MTRDKQTLYTTSALLTAVLLCITVFIGDSSKLLAAVIFIVSAVAACLLIRKRSRPSIHKRQVLLLLAVIGLLYISILYISGSYFGFGGSTVPFSLSSLLHGILPITAIIICSEIIRQVLLAQHNRPVSILGYIIGILSELLCSQAIGKLADLNQFMDLVGMTLFPAISANLLYHYLSARYGTLPNITYRLLTVLYPYILPVVPMLPNALMAFIKLGVPLAIYFFLKLLYEPQKRVAKPQQNKVLAYGATALSLMLIVGFILLISCQFRFGTIVIATESMTGAINKGDAVIYERYEAQAIKQGQIIIFDQDGRQIVHRVIKTEHINGESRYYTKGDANKDPDPNHITSAQIIGLVKFKVSYVGYPTVWLHERFSL